MTERNYCIEAPLSCASNLTDIFGWQGWVELFIFLGTVVEYAASGM